MYIIPRNIIIILRVVINEGIRCLVVIMPLTNPIKLAKAKINKKTHALGSIPDNRIKKTPENAYSEPTERSNSPDIIKKATPVQIIPSSAATVKITERLLKVKNSLPKIENITKKVRKPIKDPNSGLFFIFKRNLAMSVVSQKLNSN